MTPIAAFVLGLLIGWLIEWIIDWVYWRRRKPIEETSRATEVIIQPPTPDNLEDIKGIGPVIARLLNEKGITTFEQLAEQTPESLRGMLGDAIQRLADEGSLIEQARQFAQRKQGKGAGGQ